MGGHWAGLPSPRSSRLGQWLETLRPLARLLRRGIILRPTPSTEAGAAATGRREATLRGYEWWFWGVPAEGASLRPSMAQAAPAAMPRRVHSPRDKRRRASRVPVVKAPRALRPPGPQARELFASSQPLPEGSNEEPAAPCPGLARRRQGLHRPRHVRTIFEPEAVQAPQLRQPHRFRPERAVRTWCDFCCRYIFSTSQRCAGEQPATSPGLPLVPLALPTATLCTFDPASLPSSLARVAQRNANISIHWE